MHQYQQELQALAAAEQAAELFNKLKRSKNRSGVEVGKVFILKDGPCEVIEYKSSTEVTVKFLKTGTVVKTQAQHIINNKVKDRLCVSVRGLGYLGASEVTDISGKVKASYKAWTRALTRVLTREEYASVAVSDDFRCFEKFETWYDKLNQPFLASGAIPELEKDLASLLDGMPKAYDLDRCFLAPKEINLCIRDLERQLRQIDTAAEEELPPGISLETERKLLKVSFRTVDKIVKSFGWFKLTELNQAKAMLRAARISDFKARCKPFFHLLPVSLALSIQAMTSDSI